LSGDNAVAASGAQSAPYLLGDNAVAASGARSAPYLLTDAILGPVVDAAVAYVVEVEGDAAASALRDITYSVVDLPGDLLGLAGEGTIQIDVDAAGYGWFIEKYEVRSTKYEGQSAKYKVQSTKYEGQSTEYVGSAAVHGIEPSIPRSAFGAPALVGPPHSIDLLTVVMHELGHLLGYDHEAEGLMAETLPPGMRWLPGEELFESCDDLDTIADTLARDPLETRIVDEAFGSLVD
jgi:hypothetical protein